MSNKAFMRWINLRWTHASQCYKKLGFEAPRLRCLRISLQKYPLAWMPSLSVSVFEFSIYGRVRWVSTVITTGACRWLHFFLVLMKTKPSEEMARILTSSGFHQCQPTCTVQQAPLWPSASRNRLTFKRPSAAIWLTDESRIWRTSSCIIPGHHLRGRQPPLIAGDKWHQRVDG